MCSQDTRKIKIFLSLVCSSPSLLTSSSPTMITEIWATLLTNLTDIPYWLQTLREKVTKDNLTAMVKLREVWAVKGGGEDAAPVTLRDGRLHLHSLRKDTRIPSEAVVVPVSNNVSQEYVRMGSKSVDVEYNHPNWTFHRPTLIFFHR